MGNAQNVVGRLDLALKRLEQRWQEAKARWDDPVQLDFEKRYWAPLRGETSAMIEEMRAVTQAIAKARQRVR